MASEFILKNAQEEEFTLEHPNNAGAVRIKSNELATKLELAAKVALAEFTGANQSLGVYGYQKLPGGLILQWGFVSTANNNGTIVFPISFPGNISYVFATNAYNGSSFMNQIVTFGSTVPHNSSIKWNSTSAFIENTNGFQWFAIGY